MRSTNQLTSLWHVDEENNTWLPYDQRSKRQLKTNVDYYTWLMCTKIHYVLMYLELSRYNGYFVQETTSIFHATFLAYLLLKIYFIMFERSFRILGVCSVEVISVRLCKLQSSN